MVGFNDNYLDRSAGLRRFAAQQVVAPAQSVEEKSSLGKFLDFATEAFTPGHVQQNEAMVKPQPVVPQQSPAPVQQDPAFRNTFLGKFASAFLPGLTGHFEDQDRADIAQYAQNMPTDPVEAIKGMMAADPRNAERYANDLLQLTAQQGDPLRKLQIQNAEAALNGAKTEQERLTALGNYLKAQSQPTAPEGGVVAPSPPSGSSPIGAENNNYLNIRDNSANAWQGQTGANGGFATFQTPELGFRAAAKTLNSYAQDGVNTIDGVIQRWAPAADNNNPEEYADFVSRETGIPRNVSINPADPAIQRRLLGAMQKMEVGRDKAAPQSVVDDGVQLAQGINTTGTASMAGFKEVANGASVPPIQPVETAQSSPLPAQPKSALSKYQDMALQMAALDPRGFGANALAAFAPNNADSLERERFEETQRHNKATEKAAQQRMSQGQDYVDPDTGEIIKGSGKILPVSAAKILLEDRVNLRKAQDALSLASGKDLTNSDGSIRKADRDATGWKGYSPQPLLQRMDSEGVDTRAAIADLGSMIVHDRSGAAVTAAETPRLMPFIPVVTDDPDVVRKKLSRFVSEYKSITEDMANFYKDGGYRVPDATPHAADGNSTEVPEGISPEDWAHATPEEKALWKK